MEGDEFEFYLGFLILDELPTSSGSREVYPLTFFFL